jgi:cobalt/nickel transport system permease protein
MSGPLDFSVWAVHISDGVLTARWWLGGWVVAALLALLGAWRIRDEEIPHVALVTAVFFVASLIHVKLPPTSVHLLLNGLVGVVLGRRAALAIPIGLTMQAALLFHGGFTTIGINSCIMIVPALLAGLLFRVLHAVPWLRRPWFRSGLVAAGAVVWMLGLVYSVAFISTNPIRALEPNDPPLDPHWANAVTFHPLTLAIVIVLAAGVAWAEHRLENAPEFPLGLLVGEGAVLATALLNCLVLSWGGQEDWHTLALLVFVAHLPVALVEGIVVGFAVGFLAKVKPEMLGWSRWPVASDYSAPRTFAPHIGPLPMRGVETPVNSTEEAT